MPPSGAFSPQYTSSLLLTNRLLLGGSLAAVVPAYARHLCDLFCCAQSAPIAPSDVFRLHRAMPYDNIRPHAKRQGGAGSVGLTLAPACLGNREGAGLLAAGSKTCSKQVRWRARQGRRRSRTSVRICSVQPWRRGVEMSSHHALTCMGLHNPTRHRCNHLS